MTNWKIIGFFFAGMLLLLLLLQWQGKGLITPAAPLGIVSLEFSCDTDTTHAIVGSWNPSAIGTFRWNMLLDFLVIPFYGLFLYSFCGYFSVHYPTGVLQRTGVLMAFASLLAMCFDVLENILMIISVHFAVTSAGSVLTCIFAFIKFGFISLAVLYILFSAIYALFSRKFSHTS